MIKWNPGKETTDAMITERITALQDFIAYGQSQIAVEDVKNIIGLH
jgi:hypothetical protein